MSVPFAAFGPGILIVTRTDLTTPVPVNVGYAQELSIDLAGTIKELYGQNQFPLVQARGTIKATGKIKTATISGIAWNNIFFGQTLSPGSGFAWTIDEAGAVPAAPAYTVQVAGHTTFDADLGVRYAATGLPLQRVAGGAEALGKYSESGGTYTFAAADSNAAVLITYTTTITTATSQQLTVANKAIGFTPTFQLDYYTNLNQPGSTPFAVRLFACVASKLSMAFKLEDYMMPEFDFGFFANNSGNVMEMVYPQIS